MATANKCPCGLDPAFAAPEAHDPGCTKLPVPPDEPPMEEDLIGEHHCGPQCRPLPAPLAETNHDRHIADQVAAAVARGPRPRSTCPCGEELATAPPEAHAGWCTRKPAEHYYGDGCPEHPARPEGTPIYPGDQPIRPQLMPIHPRHLDRRTWNVQPGLDVAVDLDAVARDIGTAQATARALVDVANERLAQIAQWGEQRHPNGTSGHPEARRTRDMYRRVTQRKAAAGRVTWWDILREEFFEVGAETDDPAIREELIQLAGVATAWVEDIDRRAALPVGPTLDATMAARLQDDANTRPAGADQ